MGTSNLYGGPKKTVLLPADYIQDGDTEGDAVPAVSTPNELDPEAEIPNEAPSEAMQPSDLGQCSQFNEKGYEQKKQRSD